MVPDLLKLGVLRQWRVCVGGGGWPLKGNAKCKMIIRKYSKEERANRYYNTGVGIMDAFFSLLHFLNFL